MKRRSGAHLPVDEKRQEVFLAELRRTGSVVCAARAASPHATGPNGGLTSFASLCKSDPAFAAAVTQAKQDALASVEAEIHRRAMEPPQRPVWHRGEMVGYAEDRSSSDKLLLRLVERLDPSWSPRAVVDQKIEITATVLSIRPEDVLLLVPAEQDQLMQLLGKVADARGEADDELPRLSERSIGDPVPTGT